MKLGIAVNVVGTEESGQTTYRLAVSALRRGHQVWVMTAGSFALESDGRVFAHARAAPPASYDSAESYLTALRSQAKSGWIEADALDLVLLRSNPAVQTPWAQHAPLHFGRILANRGVVVLNDPNGLANAMNKLYLEEFPQAVRPRTLITRNRDRIREFADEQGTIVVKPLQGYGGRGVFIVRPKDRANVAEIIRAVSRDGYVVAQEYLPAAADGDTRLFMLEGRPLEYEGHLAAFRRIRTGDDLRSNLHAGGRLRRAEVDETMLRLAETVGPKLAEDGMFLAGLDIAGEKLMEINVFSPGGLGSAQLFEKVDFSEAVVSALERRMLE
ncbi:MAG: glutathione synthase [Deltaproteobacteria bacterium]|jgi:glutathione synthase|nr:glutathione synthase [Deltaproteobacteria bacterium]MBW2543052.1 glutathione synthase [Deltaproteobacteria bacterium]